MQHRTLLAALIGALILSACGGQPAPEPVTPVDDDSDRIAAEEAARREAEERRRAEEEEARRRAEQEQLAREATARARAILEARVHFDYDRSDVRADAEQTLMEKVPVLQSNPDVRLRIEGHADERGSTEYNLALGERRASAVREFLTEYGISASRLDTQSFGKERPLAEGSNEDAWERNRRAEFQILAGGDQMVVSEVDR